MSLPPHILLTMGRPLPTAGPLEVVGVAVVTFLLEIWPGSLRELSLGYDLISLYGLKSWTGLCWRASHMVSDDVGLVLRSLKFVSTAPNDSKWVLLQLMVQNQRGDKPSPGLVIIKMITYAYMHF